MLSPDEASEGLQVDGLVPGMMDHRHLRREVVHADAVLRVGGIREVALGADPVVQQDRDSERSGGSGTQTCFSSDVRTTSGAGSGVRVTVGCGEGEGAAASFDEPQAEATSERPQVRATSFPTALFIAASL